MTSPRAANAVGLCALTLLAALGVGTRASMPPPPATVAETPRTEPTTDAPALAGVDLSATRPEFSPAHDSSACMPAGNARAALGPTKRSGRGPDYVQVKVVEHNCKIDRERMVRMTATARTVELESYERQPRATPVSTKTTAERAGWTTLERCLDSTGFFDARSACEPPELAFTGGGSELVQVDAAVGQRANSVAWTGVSPHPAFWACVAPLFQASLRR